MFALRYAYVAALVLWIGGMAVLATVVAPTVFDVLQRRDPVQGRVLAGAVFGEALRRFQWVAYGAGGVMLATLALMAVLGPRPRGFGIRAAVTALMLAATLYSGQILTTRIAALQTRVDGPINELPAGDPRRSEFGRLHGLSNVLMLLNLAGGLVLLLWEAREN